jgi:hypothetical protein
MRLVRSTVIADASTNSAERAKADLKNIMVRKIVFGLVFGVFCESRRVSLVLSWMIEDVEVQVITLMTLRLS